MNTSSSCEEVKQRAEYVRDMFGWVQGESITTERGMRTRAVNRSHRTVLPLSRLRGALACGVVVGAVVSVQFGITACSAPPPRPLHAKSAPTDAFPAKPVERAVGTDLDVSGWSGPEHSTYQHPAKHADDCLTNIGCPFDPAHLHGCPPDVAAVHVDELLEAPEDYSGRQLVVKGPLYAVGDQLLRYCGCCNQFQGALMLVSRKEPAPSHPKRGHALGLWDPESREAYRCVGDDTRQCCSFWFLPGQEVLAHGTVELPEKWESWMPPVEVWLTGARLCQLDAPEPPTNAKHTPKGCIWQGTLYGPSDHFATGDQQCGCYRGRVDCVRSSEPLCYHTGFWYRSGERFAETDALRAQRVCERGTWTTIPVDSPSQGRQSIQPENRAK